MLRRDVDYIVRGGVGVFTGINSDGYVADYAATLEPTVPLPVDGPGLPESRFVIVETLVRFDHGAGVAEVLFGDVDGVAVDAPTAAAAAARSSRELG